MASEELEPTRRKKTPHASQTLPMSWQHVMVIANFICDIPNIVFDERGVAC